MGYNIKEIKEDIVEKIGQKIIVRGHLGRGKQFEKKATLEKAYPCLFRVKFDEERGEVTTYNYTDILTKTVELDVYDGVKYTPLIQSAE